MEGHYDGSNSDPEQRVETSESVSCSVHLQDVAFMSRSLPNLVSSEREEK